jgi:signal transduction histidine kinase
MIQDGNAYHGLTPERKLQQFLFEAERFMTSIVGYSKFLSADAQKPPLQNALSPDFVQSLDAIQTTGGKFARSLREITTPENNNAYKDPLVRQRLLILLHESLTPISVITGYSQLLELEAKKCELPPKFAGNLEMLQTAAERLSKTREELAESMK